MRPRRAVLTLGRLSMVTLALLIVLPVFFVVLRIRHSYPWVLVKSQMGTEATPIKLSRLIFPQLPRTDILR